MWLKDADKPRCPQVSKRDVKQGQRAHAKERAKQRYGLVLNRSHILLMVEKIQELEAIFLCKESRTRTHYIVEHDGTWMIAVYDRGKKNIATFMPRSAFFDRYIKLIDDDCYEELKEKGVLEYLENFKPVDGEKIDYEA